MDVEICLPFNTTANNKTTVVKNQVVVYEMLMIAFNSAFIMSTNLALVIGLKKTNKQLTLSQKLYIYLSLNDSVGGFVSLPYFFLKYVLSIDYCVLLSISMSITMYTFSMSLGTFAVISILRSIAIRKPFNKVKTKVIFGVLAAWNFVSIMMSLVSFFTYHPKYASYTLYCFSWLYSGCFLFIEVFSVVTLNLWSKRVLMTQLSTPGHENEIDKYKRKRNQKAVGMLNILTIVYTFCTFPVSLYYIFIGMLLLWYTGNDKKLFDVVHDLFGFFHLLLYICSGFNALVYTIKDKNIRRYYSCRICLKKNPRDARKRESSVNRSLQKLTFNSI